MSLEPAFVVHMVEATDADILACADAGIPIVICPRSNRFFGKTARAARMLELGAEVALGTDNAMPSRHAGGGEDAGRDTLRTGRRPIRCLALPDRRRWKVIKSH